MKKKRKFLYFLKRNPLIIKQIKIKENEGYRVMTFINPNFNISFRKNFFLVLQTLAKLIF